VDVETDSEPILTKPPDPSIRIGFQAAVSVIFAQSPLIPGKLLAELFSITKFIS
jgi:hypothetical protein